MKNLLLMICVLGYITAFAQLQLDISSPLAGTNGCTGGCDFTGETTLAIQNAQADDATKGAASFDVDDFNSASGNISIDYPNAQAATTLLNGFVTTITQTFGGNKTFANNLYIAGSGANQLGINTTSPAFIFDMCPASTDMNNPVFMVRNAAGNNGFLMDLESDNMRFGIFDNAGDTKAKFRSNGISFVKLKFEVGRNIEDLTDQNPQFKVLGLQDYITDKSDMTFYQSTIQNHINTSGQSAALGFGVDAGSGSEEEMNDPLFEITNQKIGGYIALTRTGANSQGDMHLGVLNPATSLLEDVLVLSGTQANFPKQNTSSIAVFDGSRNLISGTLNTSTSGLQLASNALSLNINNLSTATSIDKTNDLVAIYDASTGTTVKTSVQNIQTGYTLQGSSNGISPAGSSVIFVGAAPQSAGTTADVNRIYIPKSGTIKTVYVFFYTAGTTTSENSAISLRLNNTSNINVGTINNGSAKTTVNNTSLSTTVNAGDYVELRWVTPVWTTAPTDVRVSFFVYIE